MADEIKYIPSMGRITVKLSEDDRMMKSTGYSLIAEVTDIGPLADDRPLGYTVGDKVKLQHLHGHAWELGGEVFMTLNAIDVESRVEVVPGQQ
jgi:hypothetical protein